MIKINYATLGPMIVGPELNVSERFESTGVVTVIEWDSENGVSYNISTFPKVLTTFIGEMAAQLIIPYNIHITVNVSATLSGQRRTTIESFYHGEPQSLVQYVVYTIIESDSIITQQFMIIFFQLSV